LGKCRHVTVRARRPSYWLGANVRSDGRSCDEIETLRDASDPCRGSCRAGQRRRRGA